MRQVTLAAILALAFAARSDASTLPRLPRSAEACLRSTLQTDTIGGIQKVTFRRVGQFEYLGFLCEYSQHWANVQRGRFVLRKRHAETDWSKAILFAARVDIRELFRLSPRQFRLEVERPLPDET